MEEQQNEGTTTSDGETVVTASENERAGVDAEKITSANDLRDKLQGVGAGKKASFELMSNIDYNDEIFLDERGSNITLDLNGCKIKHSGDGNKPLAFSAFPPGKEPVLPDSAFSLADPEGKAVLSCQTPDMLRRRGGGDIDLRRRRLPKQGADAIFQIGTFSEGTDYKSMDRIHSTSPFFFLNTIPADNAKTAVSAACRST